MRHLKLDILLLTIIMLLVAGCDQAGKSPVINTSKKKVIIYNSEIPNFADIKDVHKKKQSFFNFMRPIIELENASVLKNRERLLGLHDKHLEKTALSSDDLAWLDRLRKKYKVKQTSDDPDYFWDDLLRRVDIMPMELALIQAAMESGWGTSRFALAGNNIFGQWCFTRGCGIVPDGRDKDAKHEVRKFGSVKESVRSYIHNLNTNKAYNGFRELRFEQRKLDIDPSGYGLVSEMPKYSERGEEYIEEIRSMILTNMPYMGS